MNVITSVNVIREVMEAARTKQEEYVEENRVYCSSATKTQRTKVIKLAQEILSKVEMIPEVRDLFLDYDSQVCLLESYLEEDQYVSGFVDGFDHSSKLMKDGGEIQ